MQCEQVLILLLMAYYRSELLSAINCRLMLHQKRKMRCNMASLEQLANRAATINRACYHT
eukprot:12954-Heterococcus_DN1.PRE.4